MSDGRLGRGLDHLLPEDPEEQAAGDLRRLPVDSLQPNPEQPRERFDPDRLEELEQSIRAQGVLEPVLVRPRPDGGFELVAGERRWRAARAAELREIPAVVRDLDDQQALALALVENLQREDLSPIEEARGYERLLDQHDWTQQQLAESLGRSRSSIANRLRLLSLPSDIQDFVRTGDFSAGHARSLISLDDPAGQIELAETAIREDWSVRRLEQAVRETGPEGTPDRSDQTEEDESGTDRPDPHFEELQARLEEAVGTEVEIVSRDRKQGHVRLYFGSPEEFDDLLDRLGA